MIEMISTRKLVMTFALAGSFAGGAGATVGPPHICANTARLLFEACQIDVSEEERVAWAVCQNLKSRSESQACLRDTRTARSQALAECREVRQARVELCGDLGRGAYDPVVDPDDFVDEIDNPYAPFAPGAFWEYEKHTEEGLERILVEVLDEPREILGVEVTTVRDRVWLDGVLIEDTRDWVAQDEEGNVWYFGEISVSYEDGLPASLDGSFEAGKDGAKPGIWVKGYPRVGEVYRQEWAPGEAEDAVEVLDTDAPDDVPFANGQPVLKTRDFTPLSPGGVEHKFYVPGIGVVLELHPGSDERLELVDYGPR